MDKNQGIAIVGIGGVFPGANDLQSYWENILAAKDCSREPPAGRWLLDLDDVYQAGEFQKDKTYSRRACFVDGFTPKLDGLNLDMDYVAALDPMVQLLLHAANQAWRDGQTGTLDLSRVGSIIGNIALPTDAASAIADETILPIIEKHLLGSSKSRERTHPDNRYVAGLPVSILARGLGIGGVAYTLDAACASSLYALKYAVDELVSGRADAMLCGGLSRPDALYTQMGFSALHAVSASGHCSPFDRKGDGLVVGEGCGMLLIKRLEDAIAHGDHIYATVESAGLSNDIEGNLMSPDSEGQLRAMHAAYEKAEWDPSDVDLIECHGTGTPVGDAVEFNSLCTLWGDRRNEKDCVIGSVKSNIGHLLTAAGAAGLIKVLLAMQEKQLPPTANFSEAGVDLDDSPFTVLSKARPWETLKDKPRRAAISAFGFGGINAHVLLQEWRGEKTLEIRAAFSTEQEESIAVVGLDTSLGPWKDLAAFRQRIFHDAGLAPGRVSNTWGEHRDLEGYCLEQLDFPLGRFRIPPNELKDMLPQQLLMLMVAARAIDDAAIDSNQADIFKRAGVYIGIAQDLSTTNFHLRWQMLPAAREWARQLDLDLGEGELENWVDELRDAVWPEMNANRTMGGLGGIVASRIARAFEAGGPSFTVSSEDTSGLSSVETAVRSLKRGDIDLAIVGAVDIASDIRMLPEQGVVGEGAAAVVLKRAGDAERDGDRVYAYIKGTGAASSEPAKDKAHSAFKNSLERCLEDGKAGNASVGLVLTQDPLSAAEAGIIEETVRSSTQGVATAVVNTGAHVGESGAAAGMVSLAEACLALHHQLIPHSGSSSPAVEAGSEELFSPGAGQYWLRDRSEGERHALVSASGRDGQYRHVVLEGATQKQSSQGAEPPNSTEALFCLRGRDRYSLVDRTQALRAMAAEYEGDIHGLAKQWWKNEKDNSDGEFALSIVSASINELVLLLKQAQGKIEAEEAINMDNMFYSTEPLARDGKVAFVFPGSGSHFMGMGTEMSRRWPQVLARLDEENEKLGSQFAHSRFWTRENTKGFSHEDYIFGQVWLGAMVSDVIAGFGVKPDAVIGYCLGETVGLFATRSWADRDLMLKRMQETRLFTHDLGGNCEAARQVWGLDESEEVDWQLGVVDRSVDDVREALQGRERVYLLIVNTPGECVIGGNRAAVAELVSDMGCGFHPLEGVTTVHCEVVKPVEDAYRELHLFDTTPPEGVSFYSGVAGSHYQLNRESAAESITQQALQTFDYTRLVNAAWNDGVRLFIEMGPGASCSRMIGRILGDKPHRARSACVAGQSDVGNVLRILAMLNSEGVQLDLSALYEYEDKAVASGNSLAIEVGKQALNIPLPRKKQAQPASVESAQVSTAEVIAHPGLDRQLDTMSLMIDQLAATEAARAEAEEAFLRVANGINQAMSQAISTQMQLLQDAPADFNINSVTAPAQATPRDVAFDRDMCMEYAIGSIAKMLGPRFAEVDSYPTRVRLPDEPLMLVDRIIEVEGEAASMTHGRVVTEHDVLEGAWYLDAGRIPTCIAVEAGQADLFLSGYLGIDLETKGLAVYRLLDAEVCFHGSLPHAGQVIHYDIHIDHFFRQGDTWLFRFHFDGTVNGEKLITMRNGCAGFFSQAELDAGRGIVLTSLEQKPVAGKTSENWSMPLAMQEESYSDAQLDALRKGDLATCFGGVFEQLSLNDAMGLPGGRMTLVHRILSLEPQGGRYGLGMITGEADIHEDDWFITCHFMDDQVMPGTLMYECCLHTLRVYLLRMGWVGEVSEFVYEPVQEVTSKLKCRGQVLASTSKVEYQISIKEIGYRDGDGVPYVIADALMSADGRAIVQMSNMSLQLTGLDRARIEARWAKRAGAVEETARPVLFDYASINAFAVGKPSEAFGDRYRVFDDERIIARLPGPPFQFLDRIVSIEDCEQWQLKAGGTIVGEYDVPVDAWYFEADRQHSMPFSVLLEIALQPCGWLAAYLGSALTSDIDMSFRNLGGKAKQLQAVNPDCGTLSIKVKITNVALSGGMIIQNYDFAVSNGDGLVYVGDTYFGFFSKAALADQVGIRDVTPYEPGDEEQARASRFTYPSAAPYPDDQMRMVGQVECFDASGGPHGLGFIRGTAEVNPDAWFFKAHFYQDPVWPGSLGLESFLQLLKVVAIERWSEDENSQFQCMALEQEHSWLYRGQIIPADEKVTVQASITAIDDGAKTLHAEGFLSVDGRIIYQMNDFALKMTES